MDQATHNRIVSFIWGIADDVLRDLFRPLVVSCGTQQSKSRSSWSPVGMWAGCV
jgi:hypothetical protein